MTAKPRSLPTRAVKISGTRRNLTLWRPVSSRELSVPSRSEGMRRLGASSLGNKMTTPRCVRPSNSTPVALSPPHRFNLERANAKPLLTANIRTPVLIIYFKPSWLSIVRAGQRISNQAIYSLESSNLSICIETAPPAARCFSVVKEQW